MERIYRLYNRAFVGVTKVLVYHNARNKRYESTIMDVFCSITLLVNFS